MIGDIVRELRTYPNGVTNSRMKNAPMTCLFGGHTFECHNEYRGDMGVWFDDVSVYSLQYSC